MLYKILLLTLSCFSFHNIQAQRKAPLLLLDGEEISFTDLRKMEPNAIGKYDFITPKEAVKQYSIRGRFGVTVLSSNKKPVSYKNGLFSATLYFIPDTPNSSIHVTNCFGNDLKQMFSRVSAEHPHCNLCLDYLIYRNDKDSITYLDKEMSYFNLLNCGDRTDSLSIQMAEFLYYAAKPFLSGTIYFSGNSFPNVITVTKKDFPSLPNLFARCTPGSVITFENCVYKETNGTLSKPLSKSIKLE